MAKIAAGEAVSMQRKVEQQRADFEAMVKKDAQSKMDADVDMQKAALLEAQNEQTGAINIERENRKSEFEGRMRDVQSELTAVRSIETKLKELLDYSTHKETEIILLSTSMDPGSRIGDFASGEQRGELADAAVADYRFGKTGAQLAEAGLFKLKVRDVSTGKTVVFQFEDGEKPGAGFDGAKRDCNAPGVRLGKLSSGLELFWHAGAGGCFNRAHMGFSTSADPMMDCKDDSKAAHASVVMHWGHFHRRNVEVSSMYAFGAGCAPEEHNDDGREILTHRMVVTGYFSDMPDLAKRPDPDADGVMFEEKPVKKPEEIETGVEGGVEEKEEEKEKEEGVLEEEGDQKEESGSAETGGSAAEKEMKPEAPKISVDEWAGIGSFSGSTLVSKEEQKSKEKEAHKEEKAHRKAEAHNAEPKETPGPDGTKLAPNEAGDIEGWAGVGEKVPSSNSGSGPTNSLRRR
jgi:hypothetical protein